MMRELNVLAALGALSWLTVTVLRQPASRIHWTVTAYLLSQLAFIGSAWWAATILGSDAADSIQYKRLYGIAAILPIVFMLAIAIRYSMEHGRFYGVALSLYVCGSFAVGISCVLRRYVIVAFGLSSLTPTIRNHFILASVLLAAGCATLLSLAAPSGDIECAVKVALGLYWLADGFYRFAYAVAMVQPHLRSIARFDWIPIALALLMAVGLSHKLNTSQKELGFQSLPDIEAAEMVTGEIDYEA